MGAMKKRTTLSLIGAILAGPLLVGHALSAQTPWVDFGAGEMRVVIADPLQLNGEVRGFLDIKLEPGWKTYWRDPGSSGIPPQFDLTASSGIANFDLHFPVPVWIENEYGDYAGYDRSVRLPFSAQIDGAAKQHHVRGQVLIGVCKEVCIPAQMSLDLPLVAATTSSLEARLVDQSFAQLPAAMDANFALAAPSMTPDGATRITIKHPPFGDNGGKPSLFVYGKGGEQFKPARLVESRQDASVFDVEPVKPPGTRTLKVTMVFSGASGAFEHQLEIPVLNR